MSDTRTVPDVMGVRGRRGTAVAGITHAALRIGAGLLFMQHGVQKLFGWLGGFRGEPGATAELFSMMGLAGVLEVFGGLLIVVGLLTRPVAVVLGIEMIAGYVIAHMPQGGFPIENEGELALLYVLVFAFLAGNGAGPASVDGRIAARRRSAPMPSPGPRREPGRGTGRPPRSGWRRTEPSRTSD